MRRAMIVIPLLLALAAAVSIAPAAAQAQGYSYTLTTTMQSPMTSGVVMRATVTQDRTGGRMDVQESMQPAPLAAGDYMLFGPGNTMTFVYVARREYSQPTAVNLMAMATAAAPNMKISNVQVAGERLGVDTVLGHPSRHVRMTQQFSMSMDLMGGQQVATSRSTIESWLVDLPMIANPLVGKPAMDSLPENPFRELVARSAAVTRELGPGLALKQVQTTTSSVMGSVVQVSQTTGIADLREATLDPARMVIPEGFKKVEFRTSAP